MCNENNHNSYGLVLTYVTVVGKRVVYIIDEIIVFFFRMDI